MFLKGNKHDDLMMIGGKMTERETKQYGPSSRHYKKMALIIVLISLLFSTTVTAVLGRQLADALSLRYVWNLFLLLWTIVLVQNFAMLVLISHYVIKPMVKLIQQEKSSFMTDTLTGLCRREVLEERTLWYEHDYESIGILYVDVNNLKVINDYSGHYAGDELIKKVANQIKGLRDVYQELDYYRIGGDEFIIIIKNLSEYRCRELATTLKERIASITLKRCRNCKVSAAIGFSYSNSNISILNLVKLADEDMYRNKKSMKEEMYK
jgi:diguanylate cyclase (GGDEF)-like protein